MGASESDIRALLGRRSEAMRAKDIDRLMPIFAPDIVYFDLVPPLRYTGFDALRIRFSHWFEGWQTSIGMEMSDLTISADGDVAIAFMLLRASGTLRNGRKVGYWVRTSNGFRRSDQGWLITHEHVSLPVEFPSGRAVMDLSP